MAQEQQQLPEIKLDPTQLYREEIFTDRKAGTLRRLVPVTADGSLVNSVAPRGADGGAKGTLSKPAWSAATSDPASSAAARPQAGAKRSRRRGRGNLMARYHFRQPGLSQPA